jgi:hypothetical protein
MPLPTGVESLADLIGWLATTYHHGSRYAIAKHAGIHHALIDFWFYGLVKRPRPESLEKLAEAYGLPLYDLVMLGRTPPRPPRRRPLAVGAGAPVSDNKPGPVLRKSRRKRDGTPQKNGGP